MNSLRIDILPKNLQQEIRDYYEFLVQKYNLNPSDNKKRPSGLAKGEFSFPDSFNDPLPDDLINDFYK